MPFSIVEKPKGHYYVENTETKKRFSKKPMNEKNAIKQFKILNKYLHTLEASGINKQEAKEISKEPLTDSDIKKYLPDVKIISHQDLKNYSSIEQLLPHKKDEVIIIWESSPNKGHWTLISRYIDPETNKPTIEYFDSYGNKINEPLKWIEPQFKNEIDDKPYLRDLLINAKNKYDVIYNSKDFQSQKNDVATCGRHCILRALTLKNENQDLSNYIKMMNEIKDVTGFNYDDISSAIIDI